MPVTQTDIANMALDLLTEAAIDSLDDDVKAARLISRHWDVTLEAELTKNTWSFAVQTAQLTGTKLATDDCNTLNWEYELPSDFLRVLPLTNDGEPGNLPIDYRVEGNSLFSSSESPRTLRYIALLVDPDDWSSLFTEVFAAALAIKIAHPLTGKANMIQVAQAAYDRAVMEARRVNAIERSGRLYRESWLVERGDWRFARP